MSTKRPGQTADRTLDVYLGESAIRVGSLQFSRSGQREFSAFCYDPAWLARTDHFAISPDLPLIADWQLRRATSKDGSPFHGAIADTEPDGWGCRVIARAHAKMRTALRDAGEQTIPGALTAIDYLLGVDDTSRIGALRFKEGKSPSAPFLRAVETGKRTAPPVIDLGMLIRASHAVENGTETDQDLRYLRGRGTSLGGMRPKCTVIDSDGSMALGKFPSVKDERSVTRGEVLALRLAQQAGINAARARIVMSDGIPVAMVTRFDRARLDHATNGRIPYLSAASMLGLESTAEAAYTDIAEVITQRTVNPAQDLRELWRRICFSMLITNVDDHLHNHGFLHTHAGQWRLAPAFDINPFPDKDRELKTWLTPDTGPTGSIREAVRAAGYFQIGNAEALAILRELVNAVETWRTLARHPDIGMSEADLTDFAPAFEHEALTEARALLG